MKNYIDVNIKFLYDKELLSQKEFGDLFDVSQSTIATYVRGRSIPSIEMIQRICKHFNITIDDFVNLDLGAVKDYKIGNDIIRMASENRENFTDKDALIKAQQETIDVLKQLNENLKLQLNQTGS